MAIGNESAVIFPKMKDGTVMMGILIYVNPDTIGQFTGLHDKNGTKIYEDDIVRFGENNYVVRFCKENACFVLQKRSSRQWYHLSERDLLEVIGNIHDNPELMKGGKA